MLFRFKSCAITTLFLFGCNSPEQGGSAVDVDTPVAGLGTPAFVSPNEDQMSWSWGNSRLKLAEPDDLAPPPGNIVISLRCDGDELSVETDIIISQDVPLTFFRPNVLQLENEHTRLTGRLDEMSYGITGWASGTFRPRKSDVLSLLSSDAFVARPLWVGEVAQRSAEGGLAERYPSPPEALTQALLDPCAGLGD